MFYRLFLSDACLGKACYEKCKYKYNHSAADIRIGDLWGDTYQNDDDGVSGAIAFTEKGKTVLEGCNCEFVEHPFDVVAEGQMRTCPKRTGLYHRTMQLLRVDNYSLTEIFTTIKPYLLIARLLDRLKHPARTFNGILKRIKKL